MTPPLRPAILYVATSLDGAIARRDDGLDWLPTPSAGQDYGYADFLARIDTLVMGRRTFDVTRSFGEWPYAGRRTIVLSRTPPGATVADVEFSADDPATVLRRLRAEPGRGIWLVGGGESLRPIFAAGLVDEIILTLVPVVLGDGRPLFLPQDRPLPLRLLGSTPYPDGLVQLRYAVEAG